uniref:CN hydrolase domain-containing protein n=1 Tax=Caenorhabditis tropicalis TaxID=1561998 RepID=A0A1I7TQ61_9PELO
MNQGDRVCMALCVCEHTIQNTDYTIGSDSGIVDDRLIIEEAGKGQVDLSFEGWPLQNLDHQIIRKKGVVSNVSTEHGEAADPDLVGLQEGSDVKRRQK